MRKPIIIRYLLILLALINHAIFAEEPSQPLSINTGFGYPEANVIQSLTEELFKRNQIPLKFQVLPNQRALINANNGDDDGEAARIYELNRYYPNLFPTDESIHAIEIMLVSKRNIALSRSDSFDSLHVGVIRGMKIAEMQAAEKKPLSLIKTNDALSLLNMLNTGRLDIALIDRISLLDTLQKMGQKTDGYYMFHPPYIQRKLHFHLHKKHQHLLPQFSQTIQEMKADGRFSQIRQQFFQQFEQIFNQSVKIIPYEK